jgi:putative endonuclease
VSGADRDNPLPIAGLSGVSGWSLNLVEGCRRMCVVSAKPWFVYLVRAANGSLYCGISDNAQRRFAAHQSGRGARFFHSSPAVTLAYVEACESKGDALRRERAIKSLKKPAKEALVAAYDGGGPVNSQAIS